MNDYLEYLEEQQKYQAVDSAIRHSADGQKDQLAQLHAYTSEWQKRYHRQLQVLADCCRTQQNGDDSGTA